MIIPRTFTPAKSAWTLHTRQDVILCCLSYCLHHHFDFTVRMSQKKMRFIRPGKVVPILYCPNFVGANISRETFPVPYSSCGAHICIFCRRLSSEVRGVITSKLLFVACFFFLDLPLFGKFFFFNLYRLVELILIWVQCEMMVAFWEYLKGKEPFCLPRKSTFEIMAFCLGLNTNHKLQEEIYNYLVYKSISSYSLSLR